MKRLSGFCARYDQARVWEAELKGRSLLCSFEVDDSTTLLHQSRILCCLDPSKAVHLASCAVMPVRVPKRVCSPIATNGLADETLPDCVRCRGIAWIRDAQSTFAAGINVTGAS